MSGHGAIARLIPHAGAMCLLESVVSWNRESIVCRATSHRDPGNPLRSAGRLPALAAIEYAAQAMAVHHGLATGRSRPRVGYLARLRDVAFRIDRLDDLRSELTVTAHQLAVTSASSKYGFRVAAEDRELVAGQALVVLPIEPGR